MKQLFFLLICLMITIQLNAQETKSNEEIKPTTEILEITDNQIKDAISKDKKLQDDVIKQLKEDEDSKNYIIKLENSNMGSQKLMMKSILSDKNLSQMAIDCVKQNPELLNKAKKITGI
jgi:hypothetical protein